MERQNRYLVVKRADIMEFLTKEERTILGTLVNKVKAERLGAGKRELNCVVVEDDWPEYEPTWAAIEARVGAAGEAEAIGD